MNQDIFTKVLPICLVLVFSWVIGRRSSLRVSRPEIDSWVLLPAMLLFTFMVGIIKLNNAEGDPDTSTWLSSLLSIQHLPDKLGTFLNYTDSRPLTVLPLYVASLLGFSMNYDTSQVVGMLCWLGTILLFYRTVRLFESSGKALLYSWFLCLFKGTTGYSNFVSYNSEHISILMITGAAYLYLWDEKHRRMQALGALSLGLLLGGLLFAKFQNVPMGLVIATLALVSFLRRKSWVKAVALVVGGVLPTLLVNFYYLTFDSLDVFWKSYFWNYFYYSYSNEFSDLPMMARFMPYRVGNFIFWGQAQGIYYIPLLFGLVGGGVCLIRRWPRLDGFQSANGLLATLLALSSVYGVLQSGSDFEHYLLYLLVPSTYLFAWMSAVGPEATRPYLLGLVGLGAVIQGISNLLVRTEIAEPAGYEPYRFELVRAIQTHSRPSDQIVVWGWADWLYVRAERAAGYRMHHTHHLFMRDSPLYAFREKIFLQDMEQNKPALFVDATSRNISTSPDMQVPFDQYSRISRYIRQHYQFIGRVRDVRIYQRNRP